MHGRIKLEQDRKRINFIQRISKLPLTWLRSADDCACLWTCMASGQQIKLNVTLRFHNTDPEDLFNICVLFALVFTMALNYSDLVYYMPQNVTNRMVKTEYFCAWISGWLRHTMFRKIEYNECVLFGDFLPLNMSCPLSPQSIVVYTVVLVWQKQFCIVLEVLLPFDLTPSCML